MALIEDLIAKGKSEVSDSKWVTKFVDKAKEQFNGSGIVDTTAVVVLDKLEGMKEEVAQVSSYGYVALVTQLSLGKEDEAKLIYLATTASFDERMAALDAASAATRQEKSDRDAAWANVKSISKEILQALGRYAVPLLLASI